MLELTGKPDKGFFRVEFHDMATKESFIFDAPHDMDWSTFCLWYFTIATDHSNLLVLPPLIVRRVFERARNKQT